MISFKSNFIFDMTLYEFIILFSSLSALLIMIFQVFFMSEISKESKQNNKLVSKMIH